MFISDVSILLIDPNNTSRGQVREILKNSIYKLKLKIATGKADALAVLGEFEGRLDFIIVVSTQDKNAIYELVNELKSSKSGSQAAYVMALLAEKQDSSYVAELVLRGFHGVVCEPFSAEEFVSVLNAAPKVNQQQVTTDSKTTKTVEFLFGNATKLIGQCVTKLISGKSISGYSKKDMAELSSTIRLMGEKLNSEQLLEILDSVLADAKPSLRTIEIRKRTFRKGSVIHPGKRAKAMLEGRRLSPSKVLSLVELSEAEFEALLNAEMSVDKKLATKLSHALGQTPDYWLDLQKNYDQAHPPPVPSN